jgi:hypothetical protein
MFFNPANIIVFLQERFSDNFQTEISHEERKFFLSFKNIVLKNYIIYIKNYTKKCKNDFKKMDKKKIKKCKKILSQPGIEPRPMGL